MVSDVHPTAVIASAARQKWCMDAPFMDLTMESCNLKLIVWRLLRHLMTEPTGYAGVNNKGIAEEARYINSKILLKYQDFKSSQT